MLFTELQFLRDFIYSFVVFVYLESLIYIIYNTKQNKGETKLLLLYNLIAIIKLKQSKLKFFFFVVLDLIFNVFLKSKLKLLIALTKLNYLFLFFEINKDSFVVYYLKDNLLNED